MPNIYLYHGRFTRKESDSKRAKTDPPPPFSNIEIFYFGGGGTLTYSRIFHCYEDVTITDEKLQILTYSRASWPQSSEGSLSCHTYCDTGHLFINGHLRGPVTLAPLTTCICFYDLSLSRILRCSKHLILLLFCTG